MGRREYIIQQALAFLDYASKSGAESFDSWASSKDFDDGDKEAIGAWVEIILDELYQKSQPQSVIINQKEVFT
jgi:hypothetical protein